MIALWREGCAPETAEGHVVARILNSFVRHRAGDRGAASMSHTLRATRENPSGQQAAADLWTTILAAVSPS